MALLLELNGVVPTIGADVFLAPTAVLAGDVRIGDRASVWFGAVLRGDSSFIEIGAESSVQDTAVIHCAQDLPTIVGARVTVGHGALLEGCVIEDGALIGMGAIVLQRARVGAGSLIAAGGVVTEGATIDRGVLAAGAPAKPKKQISGSAQRWTEEATEHYQEYRRLYLKATETGIADAED
jgi:carbonic anhydrase/acetyltransferase-like protein (isoleucine patch superfamily)